MANLDQVLQSSFDPKGKSGAIGKQDLDQVLQSAFDAKELTGAVILAKDITGEFKYEKTFGTRITIEGNERPLEIDAILYLASCTKLMTTIAALQCVERGLVTLTEDVSRIVPELGDREILTGFDDPTGAPNLRKKTKPVTLEHLLTHSSGIKYDLMDLELQKWHASNGTRPAHGATVEERFAYPFSFEPGSAWMYGASIDWVGKIVERLVGQPLETYMQNHIWGPLNARYITFWPMRNAAIQARMVDYSPRDPKGRGVAVSGGVDIQGDDVAACMGGQGGYASAPDYLEILHSILANDGKLLRAATVDEMFRPHLSEASKRSMQAIMASVEGNRFFSQITPLDIERDFGLGGLLVEQDLPGSYGRGTLTWSGGLNSTWFIDRKNGLCGFLSPQLLGPPNLDRIEGVKVACRDRIYQAFSEWKKEGSQ